MARQLVTRFDALSFDLDETLLDGSLLQSSIGEACKHIASLTGVDADRVLTANADAWREYWPAVETDWTLGLLDGSSLTLEVWHRTLKACACEDDAIVRLAQATHARLAQQAHRRFQDVASTLDSAKSKGIPMALITNGASDTQRDKLRVLELGEMFDAVIVSGEVGVAKPDVRIFEAAFEQLGVDRRYVWHVGDSLSTDVAGANVAGCVSVWINRRGESRGTTSVQPALEIRSLSELFALEGL